MQQAEEARRVVQEQVDQQANELSSRSQKAAKERQELTNLRFRCKEYVQKVESYQVCSDRKFDVEPMAAEIEELKAENQRLRNEITELKGITEPGKNYFHDDGFTLAVDLAVTEAITTAHVSCNQVQALLLIFPTIGSFFRIKLPNHRCKVPHKVVDGKMTHIEKELLYIPGRTHVKEVCATLNQAHKL
eukprot:805125-Pleurochrysis_carterae.AAC.1